MLRIRNLIGLFLCVLVATVSAAAQSEDSPKGFLRQNADGYFILVRTFATVPAGSKVFATLTTGKGELLNLETDVRDCPASPPAGYKICKRVVGGKTELFYRLSRTPLADESFKMRFAVTDATGSGKLREVDALPDFRIAVVTVSAGCKNGIMYTLRADDPSPDDSAYLETRVLKFDEWLRLNAANPRTIAAVEVQNLSPASANTETYAIKGFTVKPAKDVTTEAGSRSLNLERVRNTSEFNICVNFQEPLPKEKFDTRVRFDGNPPFELLSAKVDTLAGLSQIKALAANDAKDVVSEKELGLRGFDNSIDIGVIFTSAVKEEDQPDKTKKIVRDNLGVFDVRVAPWLRDRRSPPRLGRWQYFVTPIFLDAKVSTEKIDKDTHSLNRIHIGTEHNFRFVQKTEADKAAERGEPLKPGEGNKSGRHNKYVLTLRGVNASDRDFKRAEITGEVEFRPLWALLNRPRIADTLVKRVIKPDEDPSTAPSNFFGFQLQPFAGFNAGRTYRKKRDIFEGEEASDFVRRFFFGMDTIFDFGARVKLTLTDTFYVRGETPDDLGRNYFNSELEGTLGRFGRNTTQSLYISFERGDQPPFATRGVNAFKIGYRIRSDITKVGTVKPK